MVNFAAAIAGLGNTITEDEKITSATETKNKENNTSLFTRNLYIVFHYTQSQY
jgi:hypothetical protein